MKEEVLAAVNFLTRLVGKNEEISPDKVEVFQSSLGTILMEKFQGHWFPDKPCKGQAYRCIRVNGNERRDPVLEKAAQMCGLRYEHLKLPVELTVWVDPLEVCCRFGEDEGSYCTVASFKDNKENISDNVAEEMHSKPPFSNTNSPDCQKKQKNRRKPLEKQKKPPTVTKGSNVPQPVVKGLNPKTLPNNLRSSTTPCYMNNYFDWNLAGIPPFGTRFGRANLSHFPDMQFARRPKKTVRSQIYPSDRYHWARK